MRHPTTMDGLVSLEPRMAGRGPWRSGGRVHRVHCPAYGVTYTEFAILLTYRRRAHVTRGPGPRAWTGRRCGARVFCETVHFMYAVMNRRRIMRHRTTLLKTPKEDNLRATVIRIP